VDWAVPGDTSASSVKPAFYTASWTSTNPALLTGVQTALMFPSGPAVTCLGPLIGLSNALFWEPFSLYPEYITATVWLYRRVGTSWVWVDKRSATVDFRNGTGRALLSPAAGFTVYQAGDYHVLIQTTWWVLQNGQWKQAAWANYDLTFPSEYQAGLGDVAGWGFCRVY
jgi:hypothetical protein